MNLAPRAYLKMPPVDIASTESSQVNVTKFGFRVGDRLYPLNIISRVTQSTLNPYRLPAIFTTIAGITLAVLGIMKAELVNEYVPAFNALGFSFSRIELLEGFAGALCIFGVSTLLFGPVLYALRITMGNVEVDALVSRKRRYVNHITNALKRELKKFNARVVWKETLHQPASV